MNTPRSSINGQVTDPREEVSPPSPPLVSSTGESTSANSENGSNHHTTNPAWGCSNELHRVRSPSFGVSVSDAYKLRQCIGAQCGRGFEGISLSNSGSCQPSLQNGSIPSYIHQQQIAIPMRSVQQHHHHQAAGQSCHPHQPQSFGSFPNLQAHHPHSQMDRVMHGTSTSQQLRSMALNHYNSNSGCIHQTSAHPAGAGGYFQQTNSSAAAGAGSMSNYLEYGHHHNHQHHHHGPTIQPGASGSSYRAMAAAAHHHHSKIMSPNQAALAAYQNAYHQYSQYFHHQGMMHSLHNHQPSSSEYTWNQNMMGVPLNNGGSMQQPHQPQARMFPFINRVGAGLGQSIQQFQPHHHHHHHHGYSSCRPHIVPNCVLSNRHHPQALNRVDCGVPQPQTSANSADNGRNEARPNDSSEVQSTVKEPSKESRNERSRKTSSARKALSKLNSTSSEKSSKAKLTKSVSRLRDRQPRLVVSQKKKSSMSIAGSHGSSRKHKTTSKVASLIAELASCKRVTRRSDVNSDGGRTAKRSKRFVKRESDDDILETATTISSSGKSDDELCKLDEDVKSKVDVFDQFYLEDAVEEDCIPTPEEMIEYLERLNSCTNLNLPLHHPCSVFSDNDTDDKDSSDCSVDDVIEETECLNCLTWQQQQFDICPNRPPPGFEHLTRPSFPIELYDPSLLGSLIGSHMPHGCIQVTSPEAYFEEVQEVLTSLTCCEKHAIDKIWNMKKSASKLHEDNCNIEGSDWECLDKAIRNVLDDWTEELYFRKKIQRILFGLNLHDVYGGCCKTGASEDSTNPILGKSTFGFTPLISREEQSHIRYFIDDSLL